MLTQYRSICYCCNTSHEIFANQFEIFIHEHNSEHSIETDYDSDSDCDSDSESETDYMAVVKSEIQFDNKNQMEDTCDLSEEDTRSRRVPSGRQE
jgi:hypothetical protein